MLLVPIVGVITYCNVGAATFSNMLIYTFSVV
jgi:hypothetical protein